MNAAGDWLKLEPEPSTTLEFKILRDVGGWDIFLKICEATQESLPGSCRRVILPSSKAGLFLSELVKNIYVSEIQLVTADGNCPLPSRSAIPEFLQKNGIT